MTGEKEIELVIKIPEKEFGIDINNKFQDFFSRLKVEIKEHLINNTNLICGVYELETIDMFLNAFNNSMPLEDPMADQLRKSERVETVKSIPYLMHKEMGVPLIECKKAYDLAIEYLRDKARVKG